MTTPKVAICIPSKDDVKADFSLALSALVSYTTIRGFARIALLNQKGSMISMSRNELVDRALALGVDYLFWIDSDMAFPPNALEILLARSKDIVGATYNKRIPPYETLGRLKGEARPVTGGLEPALLLPGGMVLISAAVYKKIGFPYYFETYDYGTTYEGFVQMLKDWSVGPIPDAVLQSLYSAKGLREWVASQKRSARYSSEDYNFCRKAISAGFDIWTDFDLTPKVTHIGEQHVTCLIAPPAQVEAA